MKITDFKIGQNFSCGGKRFRCTDIGSRVVIAIPLEVTVSSSSHAPRVLDEEAATAEHWLDGPPYSVQEVVFDEYDIEQCAPDAVAA